MSERSFVRAVDRPEPLPPDDPRAVLRDLGCWEDIQHPVAHERFQAACKSGNAAAVAAYVALGIDFDSHTPISGETPLIRAAEGNQPIIVRLLLSVGADIHGRDLRGDTAVKTAVNWGSADALRALLEHGADPNLPDKFSNYPLERALEQGRDDLLALLLEHGASVNVGAQAQSSALQWCVRQGQPERLRALLRREDADPNQVNGFGDPLLHYAVNWSKPAIVAALIEGGADLHRTNVWGWTARDAAELREQAEAVASLELAGAKPGKADAIAFFKAIARADLETVQRLLDRGFDVNTRNHLGRTGLMVAAEEDQRGIAELLLERGADIEARNATEDNALVFARSTALRRLLLERGIAAAYRDRAGKLRQPGVAAVLAEDDQELLALLLDPQGNLPDLSDLSGCHDALVWGKYSGRMQKRAATLRRLGVAGADLEAPGKRNESLLHGYIDRAFEALALTLIEVGVNLDHADDDHVTPLIRCCKSGKEPAVQARIVRALLRAGADYTKTSGLGHSAYDAAASNGNEKCMVALEEVFQQTLWDALAERGLTKRTTRAKYDAALFEALARRTNYETFRHWLRKGEHAIVRGLLQAGYDPDPPQLAEGLRPRELPLTLAIAAGDLELVRILLAGGADPNLVQSWGLTAMSYAATTQAEVVAALLAAGADPQPIDDSGHAAMVGAAARNDLEVLELLHRAGASAQPRPSGYSPLHGAVQRGHFEAARWLLAHGADIDARKADRVTPLHVALEHGHFELAHALLTAGADVNVQTTDAYYRHTPLIQATRKGAVALVEALLAAGADPHVRDADGFSALWYASHRDELKRLFPEDSARPRCKRVAGALPGLLRAIHLGDREGVMAALERGGLGVTNYRGDTALMLAVASDQRHMVDVLLDAGADLRATNARGDTAWSYALCCGNDALRRLLEQRGFECDRKAIRQMADQAMRRRAVLEALAAGDVFRVAKQIAALDFDVDSLAPQRRPLQIAIERQDAAMVELLLASGADATLDARGVDPALELGEVVVLRVLGKELHLGHLFA